METNKDCSLNICCDRNNHVIQIEMGKDYDVRMWLNGQDAPDLSNYNIILMTRHASDYIGRVVKPENLNINNPFNEKALPVYYREIPAIMLVQSNLEMFTDAIQTAVETGQTGSGKVSVKSLMDYYVIINQAYTELIRFLEDDCPVYDMYIPDEHEEAIKLLYKLYSEYLGEMFTDKHKDNIFVYIPSDISPISLSSVGITERQLYFNAIRSIHEYMHVHKGISVLQNIIMMDDDTNRQMLYDIHANVNIARERFYRFLEVCAMTDTDKEYLTCHINNF